MSSQDRISSWVNEFRHTHRIRAGREPGAEGIGRVVYRLHNLDNDRVAGVAWHGPNQWSVDPNSNMFSSGFVTDWDTARRLINQWLFQGLRPRSNVRWALSKKSLKASGSCVIKQKPQSGISSRH